MSTMHELIRELLEPSEGVWYVAIGSLRDGALDDPSPRVGAWTTRALINHVHGGARRYVIRATSDDDAAAEATRALDFVGENPSERFWAEERPLRALLASRAADSPIRHRVGAITARELALLRCLELVVHALDLEPATTAPVPLREPVLDRLVVESRELVARLRTAGLYGPETPPRDGSGRSVILALTGR